MGLFSWSNKQQNRSHSDKINRSIELFIRHFQDGEKVYSQIRKICVSDGEAEKIYLFIPVAFCRLFVPEVNYSDIYITPDKAEHKFSECGIFTEIMRVSKNLMPTMHGDDIMKILYHSGDFDVVNKALKDGASLENLEFLPTVIL